MYLCVLRKGNRSRCDKCTHVCNERTFHGEECIPSSVPTQASAKGINSVSKLWANFTFRHLLLNICLLKQVYNSVVAAGLRSAFLDLSRLSQIQRDCTPSIELLTSACRICDWLSLWLRKFLKKFPWLQLLTDYSCAQRRTVAVMTIFLQ